MPSHLMYDGVDDNLFDHLSVVVHRLGVYTISDYTDIIEYFIGRWKVESLRGLSPVGQKAQEYVCRLPEHMRRLEDKIQDQANKRPLIPFSWIYGRKV
ncbi:hypothetical protein ABFS83_14G289100 [Erythranthe nasuta]